LRLQHKERRPRISLPLRERLWPFLGGIARQNGMKAIEIGGVPDKEEFLALLKKHRIAYDERYLWE
jgi:hypothetical protein